jgi:hypothetical protein
MPYIGNTPALDYISYAVQNFTVTAGTTVYTLDYSVANENDIRLVINNVIQRPGASFAYSATGTTLTLTSATLSTDTMYAVFIGRAVQTVTPPANSITNTMLNSSAITGQTAVTTPATDDVLLCYDTSATALRKITFANFGNTPAFRATMSADQNILNITDTIIAFDTEEYDTDNAYNTATYTFTTPTGKSGKYLFIARANFFLDSGKSISLSFVKNGSIVTRTFNVVASPGSNLFLISNAVTVITLADSDTVKVNINQDNGNTRGLNKDYAEFIGYRLIGV